MGGLAALIGLQMQQRRLLDLGAQAVAALDGLVDLLLSGGLLAHFSGVEAMKIAAQTGGNGEQQRACREIPAADHALIPTL